MAYKYKYNPYKPNLDYILLMFIHILDWVDTIWHIYQQMGPCISWITPNMDAISIYVHIRNGWLVEIAHNDHLDYLP